MFLGLRSKLLAAALALLATPALVGQGMYRVPNPQGSALTAEQSTSALNRIGVDQRLGENLPLDLEFRDEHGRQVRLGDYFQKGRPVVLTLVYYDCPMLCNQVLNGMTSALTVLKFDAGREFDVVAVSIDPRETPEMAANKKKGYMRRYGRPHSETGWHMLVGEQQNIEKLAEATGFRYFWDEKTQMYAHGAAIMVVSPEGRLAQYFYGIEYSPRDLRLALVESSKEKIGSVMDQLMLYCYHYDPESGRYGAVVMNIVRLAGAATVLVLGTFLVVMFRRERGQPALRRTS